MHAIMHVSNLVEAMSTVHLSDDVSHNQSQLDQVTTVLPGYENEGRLGMCAGAEHIKKSLYFLLSFAVNLH